MTRNWPSTDKKEKAKAKNKSAKDVADAKSADPKDVKTAKTSKPKTTDTEPRKVRLSADGTKKNKSVEQAAAKSEPVVAAATRTNKSAKSKPKTEEDLDAFLAQTDPPAVRQRERSRTPGPRMPVASNENGSPARKNVVPVKNEVAKGEDDEHRGLGRYEDPARHEVREIGQRRRNRSRMNWNPDSSPKANRSLADRNRRGR